MIFYRRDSHSKHVLLVVRTYHSSACIGVDGMDLHVVDFWTL